MSGVWQVSADQITKYDLLNLINRVYGLGVRVEADEEFFCDRRLDSTPFRGKTDYSPPSWEEMIEQMHADPLR
jgi:dTDP-4-dehydrorhamnose reductase